MKSIAGASARPHRQPPDDGRFDRVEDNVLFDVLIVGGGPAGLGAALVLGRCRRRVLLFDAGNPRNAASRAMHGFLSRDGMDPRDFLRESRAQLQQYTSVTIREIEIVEAFREDRRFRVRTRDGVEHTGRILLLATGLVDEVPQIQGIERFYGRSVHHCPYCDGWEHRDDPIVVHGKGQEGADLAMEMICWSRNLTLCTDGASASEIPAECRAKLEKLHIPIIEKRVAELIGGGHQIERVRFEDGQEIGCRALFFAARQRQRSELVHQMGCVFRGDVCVEHDDTRAEGVPGLYVAGNTSRGLQLVIMAAAEGTLAAFNINQALLDADLAELRTEPSRA